MAQQEQQGIFNRLRSLFSTDVIIRNVSGQLKVVDINKIQTTGKYKTNSRTNRFTNSYVNRKGNIYNPTLNYQVLRQQLYSDYEAMDTEAIISSTLDIIADEATLRNERGNILEIKTSDEGIKSILENLFYDILNIEFNLWSWVRQMCKYGDYFLHLEIAEEFGIYNVVPYTVYNIARTEDFKENNAPEIKFYLDPEGLMATLDTHSLLAKGNKLTALNNYEVAHFRLLADSNFYPYGRSYLEPARKVFKQYNLAKDAMMLHRISRAPDKRIFYINVGNVPAHEVEQFMQKTISNMKRIPYVDPQTGQYNLRFNLQNLMEDYYIPVRGNDTTTKLETAEGLKYDGIEDVKFLREELFAALKVPKAYMGFEKDLGGKATLASQDIRFARTVERIQRIIEQELSSIALVHLYVQGYKNENLTNFELSLTTPSIIYEQEKVALLNEKFGLINSMLETGLIPSDYIYANILNLSEDDYLEMRDLLLEDKHRIFRLAQIENEGNDPKVSGKSFGTPHDLAMAYNAHNQNVRLPDGYNKDLKDIGSKEPKEPGRPEEKSSPFGTQEDNFSIDRTGREKAKQFDLSEEYSSQTAKSMFYKNLAIFQPNKSKRILENKLKRTFLDIDDDADEQEVSSE